MTTNVPPASALITGASRGIGLQIAKRLAAQGMNLTVTARDAESLVEVRASLIDLGSPCVVTVAADMANLDGLHEVVESHLRVNNDMSALVLNAGVGTAGSIETYPAHRLDKTLAVNFRAPFMLIQSALPALRAAARRHQRTGAKVILLASIAGVYAEAGLAAYSGSKAAAISLADSVNAEESAAGVTATAIAPAYVDTAMSEWIHDEIAAGAMIPTEDIATVVEALVRLSNRSMIGRIIMARAGTGGYHA